MSARDTILAAVRAGLGERKIEEVQEQQIQQAAAELLSGSAFARPTLPAGSLIDAFAARLVSAKVVGATVDRIQSVEELPAAVKRYLKEKNLPQEVALQPDPSLSRLNWEGFTVRAEPDRDAQVGVGAALWGVVETGSLVFHSGPRTSILGNFLPLHHVVVVLAETIVPYLEDYLSAARIQNGQAPRNINIITGASGTTDIEGSLVRGAHGPRYLHVVIAG